MLRCMACGSSICGVPCATERWKQHRPECRRLQAVAFGEEYARKEDRSYRLWYAAYGGNIRVIREISNGLTASVRQTKFAKAQHAALQTLLDHEDPREPGSPIYGAAQENRLEAVRLLRELRADLDKPTTLEGAVPAGIAANDGHTAMVQLLYDLGADVHRARNDGARPIHSAAQDGHNETVLLLLSLRAEVNVQDPAGRTPCWSASYRGHTRVISTLLDARANVNLACEGWTPADNAFKGGYTDSLAVLLRNGGIRNAT